MRDQPLLTAARSIAPLWRLSAPNTGTVLMHLGAAAAALSPLGAVGTCHTRSKFSSTVAKPFEIMLLGRRSTSLCASVPHQVPYWIPDGLAMRELLGILHRNSAAGRSRPDSKGESTETGDADVGTDTTSVSDVP